MARGEMQAQVENMYKPIQWIYDYYMDDDFFLV